MKTIKYAVLLLLCLFLLKPSAQAQELGFSFGTITDKADFAKSYTWRLSYYEPLTDNFMISFAWYNEGHFQDHHRDGFLMQAWYRIPIAKDKFYLGFGAGPFYFFDTTDQTATDYNNVHAFALALSMDLWYYLTYHWVLKAGFTSTITPGNNINTGAFLLGAAYRFNDPAKETAYKGDIKEKNEINFYAGRTIVNSFSSQKGIAKMIEYRRNFMEYLDISASWLNEGDTSILRRNGLIFQAWPTKRFLDGKLALSLGLGMYTAVDTHDCGSNDDPAIAGIITMSLAYRLGFIPISVGAKWNRTVTSYDRDTDVIMGGIGFYF